VASLAYNAETGDRKNAVSRQVHITVAGEPYAFAVRCSRYTASMLQREDWEAAGLKLRESVPLIRNQMAMTGDLFMSHASQFFRQALYKALCQLVLERFRDRQFKAGNTEYQVDSLLAGEEYAV